MDGELQIRMDGGYIRRCKMPLWRAAFSGFRFAPLAAKGGSQWRHTRNRHCEVRSNPEKYSWNLISTWFKQQNNLSSKKPHFYL